MTNFIKIQDVANRFNLRGRDIQKMFSSYGYKTAYQFMVFNNGEYFVEQAVYKELKKTDKQLREYIIEEPDVLCSAIKTIPFDMERRIYFLILDGDIVYIGMTKDIANRISTHIKTGKRFDQVASFIKKGNLPLIEKINIYSYNPYLNKDVLTEELYFLEVLKNCVI